MTTLQTRVLSSMSGAFRALRFGEFSMLVANLSLSLDELCGLAAAFGFFFFFFSLSSFRIPLRSLL